MDRIQVESTNSLLCSLPDSQPPPLIFENVVQSDNVGISHVSIKPNIFREHSDPHLKIGILKTNHNSCQMAN